MLLGRCSCSHVGKISVRFSLLHSESFFVGVRELSLFGGEDARVARGERMMSHFKCEWFITVVSVYIWFAILKPNRTWRTFEDDGGYEWILWGRNKTTWRELKHEMIKIHVDNRGTVFFFVLIVLGSLHVCILNGEMWSFTLLSHGSREALDKCSFPSSLCRQKKGHWNVEMKKL